MERLRIDDLDLEDRTFLFRGSMRVNKLKRSLHDEGQQIPIIVRRLAGKRQYQIISGFRRAQAAINLGWSRIAAIVRAGLDDEEAFRAAVLENTARKTYSDIDRAMIIREYRRRGHGGAEVASLMGLTERQTRNLLALLELPAALRSAIDDPDQHFSATHALTLKKLAARHPSLNLQRWVPIVNDDLLSVARLKARVSGELAAAKPAFKSLFQSKGTDWHKNQVRFSPVKLHLNELSEAEKKRLRAELEKLLTQLDRR